MAYNHSTEPERLEVQLFKAADKLSKNIDAAQYKHIVLGLIFLKYILDSFESQYEKLTKEKFADPEDPDEYRGRERLLGPVRRTLESYPVTSKTTHYQSNTGHGNGGHRRRISNPESLNRINGTSPGRKPMWMRCPRRPRPR